MLHTRIVSVNVEGSAASGTVALPPSRLAGLYYKFEDDATIGNLSVTQANRTLVNLVAADNDDAPYDFDGSGAGKFEPVVHGETVCHVDGATQPGKVVFTLLLHYPGN